MGWTLQDIRNKVRRVTGRLSSAELSDNEIDTRIDQFYEYTLPAEAKFERIHTYYEFFTTPNQEIYSVPGGYVNFEPIVFANNMPLEYYQDSNIFYQQNPYTVSRSTIGTGDGATLTFPATVTGAPIRAGSTFITDNTELFEDTNTTYANSPVTITGSLGGTASVNYTSGAVSATFATAPTNGQDIYLNYTAFKAGRPVAVLLFNEEFRFYPIPDTAYKIRMKAYLKLSAFGDDSSVPLLQQWGPMIAYGTARDIHADYGEMDAYGEVTVLYKEQLRYAMSRTENYLMQSRAQPEF